MNFLIVYATKHGTTEKCAQILAKKLTGNVEFHNLKNSKLVDLSRYDRIIIGGSVHIGKVQKEVMNFCTKNWSTLKEKNFGLYICGMFDEKAEEELSSSFPPELIAQALAKDFFGGEYRFKQMNPLDALMVKKIAKVDIDLSHILEGNIDRFAQRMNTL